MGSLACNYFKFFSKLYLKRVNTETEHIHITGKEKEKE